MKNKIRPLITAALIAVVAANISNALADQTSSTNLVAELPPGQMPYFDAVNDPIEGFNRCSWAVNEWLFRGVIYPFSVGYTFIAPKPVRTGISQVGFQRLAV